KHRLHLRVGHAPAEINQRCAEVAQRLHHALAHFWRTGITARKKHIGLAMQLMRKDLGSWREDTQHGYDTHLVGRSSGILTEEAQRLDRLVAIVKDKGKHH